MLRTFITISILIISTALQGQDLSTLSGKVFIGRRLEYLKFLNDSTLYSSINSYTDTANFYKQNDTLFVKQQYLQTDQKGTKWMERIYTYQIIRLTADTISLKNMYNYSNSRDTFFFINQDNLYETISDFKFLRLDCFSPWSGTRQITIDRLGTVTFIDSPIMYSENNPDADRKAKPRTIKGKLTGKELENLKALLSTSLLSRLPVKRECPMDGATSNFEIVIGMQKIKSTGCNLSWTHAFLFNYIYDIDQNKGFIKSKK